MKPVRTRQLFVDLDGVLADLNAHYEALFGIQVMRTPRSRPEDPGHEAVFWDRIRTHGRFFRTMPQMPDAQELWAGACKLHPTPCILTGLPWSIVDVESHKREWVKEHLGPEAERGMICTKSKNKYHFCKPGDVLIDDWDKYQKLWENAGGIFIVHFTAAASLAAARAYFPESR